MKNIILPILPILAFGLSACSQTNNLGDWEPRKDITTYIKTSENMVVKAIVSPLPLSDPFDKKQIKCIKKVKTDLSAYELYIVKRDSNLFDECSDNYVSLLIFPEKFANQAMEEKIASDLISYTEIRKSLNQEIIKLIEDKHTDRHSHD